MTSQEPGFTWTFDESDWNEAAVGTDVARFRLKKLTSEFVWDLVHLENNPYDFSEVQTLMEGITVGGHTLSQQRQVLNQIESLRHLFRLITAGRFRFDVQTVLEAHRIIAANEAPEWGVLRSGEVRVSGTRYRAPRAEVLEGILQRGIEEIGAIPHPVERALAYFCFGALNLFFSDCNKRTSLWVMNGLLVSNGYNYLSIPGREKKRYSEILVDFYDTRDASKLMKFLASCYTKDE